MYKKIANNGLSNIVNSEHWEIDVNELPDDDCAIHELYTLLKGLTNDLFIDYRDNTKVIVKNKGDGDSLTFNKVE